MSPILKGIVASGISGHLTPPFTPTGSYDALASYTVPSGGVSTITFAGLPTGGQYEHLQIRAIARGGNADLQSTYMLRFNGNSTGYSYHRLVATGGSYSTSGGGSGSESYFYYGLSGTTTNSSLFGTSVWDILDYPSTTKTKVVRFLSGVDANGSGGVSFGSGGWYNTSAINSISLTIDGGSNFAQNSHFALYGLKG